MASADILSLRSTLDDSLVAVRGLARFRDRDDPESPPTGRTSCEGVASPGRGARGRGEDDRGEERHGEAEGERAIAAADKGPFDVIVIDRETPGIDGFDLVTYIRHRYPDVPILFMTAVGGALVAQTAFDRGATEYVEKPRSVEQLVGAIVRTLHGARCGAGAPMPAVRRAVRAVLARLRGRRAERRRSEGSADGAHVWGLVLAGGPGTRLLRLVRHVQGDPRPKQYARLVGSRSLLRRTLDRTALAISAERAILEPCVPLLGVSTLEGTTWCDWGSPRRVVRTLRRIGVTPAWLRALEMPERPAS